MEIDGQKMYVNAGEIVVILTSVSEQVKDDVLCSTLISQLRSSDKFGFSDDLKWSESLLAALGALGWKLQRQTSRSYRPEDLAGFTGIDILKREFRKYLSVQHVASIVDGVQAVTDLPAGSPAMELLRKNTVQVESAEPAETYEKSISKVRWLVAFCGVGSVMNLLYVYFETLQPIERNVLGQAFINRQLVSDITIGFYSAELLERYYVRSRSEVIKQLGDKRQEMVMEVFVNQKIIKR